jgi:5-methylcytosine-specific restriction endonuclease McrA
VSEPTQSQKKERSRRRATCHPDLPRKTSDGLCGNCYSRRRYQTDAEYREYQKAKSRAAARKRRPEAAGPIPSFACAYCGAMHTPKNRSPRNRFCSRACSRKGNDWGDRSPRPCEQCGDTFEPRRSFQRFCSRRCNEVSKSAYASWDEWQEAKQARVRRRLKRDSEAALAKLAKLNRRCEWCNDPMRSGHAGRRKRFCSEQHGRLARGYGVSCAVFYTECAGCGDLFVSRSPQARWCSRGCAKARQRWPISPKKRAKIIERDQGSCQLCGFPVDPEDIQEVEGKDGRPAIIAGPRYPSIDHIVPRSEGGDHTMANLRLAHRDCNSLRGATVSVRGEQLRLVG